MAKDSEVLLQPGHKWNNIVFHNHTGLKQYPNYMMGGGYVVSGDVATTLMNINRRMQLKFTPIEDATMGFWLAAMVISLYLIFIEFPSACQPSSLSHASCCSRFLQVFSSVSKVYQA